MTGRRDAGNAMGSNSRRTGLWLWLAGALGVSGLLYLTIFAIAAAVLGASFTGCAGNESATAAQAGTAPSAYALQSIPPRRLALYQHAGVRFDIDWTFLASIGTQECASGECTGVNSSGCAGPMQIAYVRESPCSPGPGPTLWERYAISVHPGQAPRVNDPADAIYTAARILRQDKGAPPIGGTYTEYRQAACNYYGACADATVAYADEVMARAVQYGFTGRGAPAPTSPQLAEPVTAQGRCSASVIAPEAASAYAIVRVAESQVGQGEHPSGSKCTIYGPCEEWCSLFASWVWMKSGVPLPSPTARYGYSGALYTWVAANGGRVLHRPRGPRPVTRSSTARAPATACTSGSSYASNPTARSRPSRATTPTELSASAHSYKPFPSKRAALFTGLPNRRPRVSRSAT